MIITSLLLSKVAYLEASKPFKTFERNREKPPQVDYPTPNIKKLKKFWRSEVLPEKWVCEPLHLNECKKEKRHTTTLLPSPFGYPRQRETAILMSGFQLLVESQCHKELQTFLCLAMAPPCDQSQQYMKPIGPCTSFCKRIKARCEPVMESFRYSWPNYLNCSQYLESNEPGNMCVDPEQIIWKKINDSKQENKKPKIICKPEDVFVQTTNSCLPKCNSTVKADEYEFVDSWLTGWSTACFVCSLFAVCTFALDQSRFKYPERPVIYISLCHMFMSSAVFIRLILGKEQITCRRHQDDFVFIENGLSSSGCTIVFLLFQYFHLASYAWWFVMALSWYFAAGLKWSEEAIGEKQSFFHSFCWGFTSLLVVVIMANRYVKGDELTGLCEVDGNDPELLGIFVITPVCAFLISGLFVVVIGCISLFKLKSFMENKGNSVERLEKLMIKMITFTVFYMAISSLVLFCFIYQFTQLQKEILSNNGESLKTFKLGRFAAQMMTGVIAGFWVISVKSIDSWKGCFQLCSLLLPCGKKVKSIPTSENSSNQDPSTAVSSVVSAGKPLLQVTSSEDRELKNDVVSV